VHYRVELDEFWVENGENPQPKAPKMQSSQRCACTRALGAHTQEASARRPAPGARRPRQDNFCVVLCSGAWGQLCRGPMRSF
jgi:hypothetical protein